MAASTIMLATSSSKASSLEKPSFLGTGVADAGADVGVATGCGTVSVSVDGSVGV